MERSNGYYIEIIEFREVLKNNAGLSCKDISSLSYDVICVEFPGVLVNVSPFQVVTSRVPEIAPLRPHPHPHTLRSFVYSHVYVVRIE